uniref:ORF77 n=1 Tax=Lymantria dispar multicapsid nuclear polyhedrosis virus TaxID=10449 RepID=A0A2S1XB07_NPVLD|nr:ORF77 [Lymantria dispar multiple nucleopolyhedrovirus]
MDRLPLEMWREIASYFRPGDNNAFRLMQAVDCVLDERHCRFVFARELRELDGCGFRAKHGLHDEAPLAFNVTFRTLADVCEVCDRPSQFCFCVAYNTVSGHECLRDAYEAPVCWHCERFDCRQERVFADMLRADGRDGYYTFRMDEATSRAVMLNWNNATDEARQCVRRARADAGVDLLKMCALYLANNMEPRRAGGTVDVFCFCFKSCKTDIL